MTTELKGAGVVVTGGGGGIGGALARRFAAEGARVIVADLDGDAASAVAEEIGGSWMAVDVSTESGVEQLVSGAKAELGSIDIFCANAGVAPHGTEAAPEELWTQAWEVNVLAHIRAAKLLLPDWLERGQGHLIATVSAAGLLTMLGSAPYSVTKHGALAFAEWLRATYSHRGIVVQAVCPQGVRTNMLANTGVGGDILMSATAIEPGQVADSVFEGLADGRFLILPHPEVADYYRTRADRPDAWLAGMNKLQRKIEAAGG